MTTPRSGRRSFLRAAGLLGTALPMGGMAAHPRITPQDVGLPFALDPSAICRVSTGAPSAAAPGERRELKLTWNANAVCTVGVPVAEQTGIFERHNLKVELINFGGTTDQLLEAIATGKADAGVGMALRWLKPLESGFDVKITSGIHGGCMRLFSAGSSELRTLESLKGKTIGVSDMAAPDKNFFSILLAQKGIDPLKDVTWRQFPADLLGVALQRGEVQAFALGDPLAWVIRERDGLHEISNNLQGEYAGRSCCVLGVRGNLIRRDKPAARALTAALLEAQEWIVANPAEAARIFAPYAKVPVEQLEAMVRDHTHQHHPAGTGLRQEIARYTEELKLVQVIRPNTDSARFSERVFAEVLL
ncbi:ABC transporter substrate-binding protein [Roseomonas chloroacetimidivorans]|uniref:ABC transporter substrate-binding protein n=1 Tax=Roseomonas chloroacetimidivorans TaxID=1766656 RepID=UPI003C725468